MVQREKNKVAEIDDLQVFHTYLIRKGVEHNTSGAETNLPWAKASKIMAEHLIRVGVYRRPTTAEDFAIIAELKKVVWLSRREAAYLTGVVIIVTVIAGLVLGFLDMGFANLVNKVFLGG